ncbi:hypothetical protein [Nonomuraea turcica]|uniref:hypothetical protein n=1 Tax=Nonomuraea sp. G32 TaxID=3067274 RepID=UPI00273AA029|nr:hypothetical protein [Nonomuraea sp. G32]MDP4504429.1 hypothetical protein [Nonomuraea sp. G32]
MAEVTERLVNAANLSSRSRVIGAAATSRVTAATVHEIIGGIVTKGNHIWFCFVNSEDVWQQFDIATWRAPHARLRMVISGCLVLAVFAQLLWWIGAITPYIRWQPNDFFLHADVDKNGVLSTVVHIDVDNEGVTPVTIGEISAEMPGLRLLPADRTRDERSEVTVGPGGVEVLTRRIVITDCAAVPYEPQPIRYTYRTWIGSGSAEVTWDSWRMDGPEGSLAVAWQRGIASKVCNEAVSSDWF